MARLITEAMAERIREAVLEELIEAPGNEISYGALKKVLIWRFQGMSSMELIYKDMRFFGVLALRDLLVEIGFSTRKVVSTRGIFRAEYFKI